MPQQPATQTIKRLFAASGNRCAFPGHSDAGPDAARVRALLEKIQHP